MKDKMLQFNARIGAYERLNDQFMKVKINICHKGKNANRTDFKETAMKDLEETVLGVPVVGEFDVDKRQFKGHGGKLVVEDDRVEWVRTTQPYGFVPLDQRPFYETILEPDGITKNDYLSVYAILWTELYPELYEAFENKMNQSMEIRVGASEWDEKGEYCQIHHATMSALCLLQAVKPCFKSSVVTNQFSEMGFDDQYRRLVEQYQQYALGEGGDDMEDNKDLAPETVEEPVVEETVVEEPVVDETVEEVKEDQTPEETPTDEQEETEATYSDEGAVEPTEEQPVEDTPVEDTPTEDTPEEEVEPVNYEQLYHDLTTTHAQTVQALEDMTAQFNALTETFNELKAFKDEVLAERRQEAEKALFARFEDLTDFEGFEELKKQSANFELEDLEKELFALAGRKMFSAKPKVTPQTTNVALETQTFKSKVPTVFGMLDEFITK